MAGKVVWLGDGTTDFFQPAPEAEPVPVGSTVTLTQAQVTHLERRGHRFALPGSDTPRDPLAAAVGGAALAERLREAGFGTAEQIRGASDEELRAVEGIGPQTLTKLQEYAQPQD